MVFYGVRLYDVVMFLKRDGPYTHNLSKRKNSRHDVPIWSQWCLVQGAACRMAALSTSCGGHIGYTCLSDFFPRFAKKQFLFCSLQTLCFSWWWKSFTTRGPILNPTKTENEFPSRGKLEIPGEDIPTLEVENLQRSHQNRKLHENNLITLMTSTGHSDASVCERLSSCAPGATAALDLGRPMQVPLPKHLKKSRNGNKFHEDRPYEMHCN